MASKRDFETDSLRHYVEELARGPHAPPVVRNRFSRWTGVVIGPPDIKTNVCVLVEKEIGRGWEYEPTQPSNLVVVRLGMKARVCNPYAGSLDDPTARIGIVSHIIAAPRPQITIDFAPVVDNGTWLSEQFDAGKLQFYDEGPWAREPGPWR